MCDDHEAEMELMKQEVRDSLPEDWCQVTLQAANSTNGDTITLDAMTVVLF